MEQQKYVPEITKSSEIFDSVDFRKNVNNTSGKMIVNEDDYTKEVEKQSYGYISRTYFNESYFQVNKKFYKNGYIKQKVVSFINGYPIEKIYEFDERGNFIKEINTDLGYDFGWRNILEYCHKNNIVLEKGYPKRGGIKTEIYKNEEEGKKVWTISYYNAKKDEYLEVTIDGKTGKELKRRKLEFIGN